MESCRSVSAFSSAPLGDALSRSEVSFPLASAMQHSSAPTRSLLPSNGSRTGTLSKSASCHSMPSSERLNVQNLSGGLACGVGQEANSEASQSRCADVSLISPDIGVSTRATRLAAEEATALALAKTSALCGARASGSPTPMRTLEEFEKSGRRSPNSAVPWGAPLNAVVRQDSQGGILRSPQGSPAPKARELVSGAAFSVSPSVMLSGCSQATPAAGLTTASTPTVPDDARLLARPMSVVSRPGSLPSGLPGGLPGIAITASPPPRTRAPLTAPRMAVSSPSVARTTTPQRASSPSRSPPKAGFRSTVRSG